jgi:Domain of unknown function (DUF4304)
MSPSSTVRAIGAASRAVAALGLRDAGFKRRGNHLHRTGERIVHAVHFQASQWGSATSGSFTVNLVVTNPFMFETWTGRPFPSNPASALFPIVMRIGSVMPAQRDHWWEVGEGTDVDVLSREVASAVIEHGLTFFEPFKSCALILERLREGRGLPGLTEPQLPLVHAMLATEAGDQGEARAQLMMAYTRAGTSPFRETVQRIADRLGIRIE